MQCDRTERMNGATTVSDDDDSHKSVTVSTIYAPLTYEMYDSVRQLIRYIKVSPQNPLSLQNISFGIDHHLSRER